MPDIAEADEKKTPQFKLEYLTYAVSALDLGGSGDGKPPVPVRHLPRSLRDGTSTTSKYAPYSMTDLTLGSWVELGRRLGQGHKKLQKRFKKYMVVSG